MQNKWIIIALTLVVGFLGGLLVGKHMSADTVKKDAHAHMHENLVEVPEGAVAPTVDAIIHTDPKGGYNVQILTENFRFAPENASTAHVFGEGHAHIYVDGVKINRVYGEWYHLASLGDAGDHEIHVELSTNDHGTYALNGEPIEDVEVVTVVASEDAHMDDDHEDDHMDDEHSDAMESGDTMMKMEVETSL